MGMGMTHVSTDDAKRMAVEAAGFDPLRYSCSAPEVSASLIAASFYSPCSARSLVRTVAESLQGLLDGDDVAGSIEAVLDELLAYGDLVEVERTASSGRLVYTTPPTFVTLASGRILLLGVCPESVEWLPATLSGRVAHRGHVRSLPPGIGATAGSLLKDAGYYELPHKLWLHAPKPTTASQVYERYVALLNENGGLTEPTGIAIVDPARPVRYYKGRWKPAAGTGFFVARREQRYGAPLWSFIKLLDGRLSSLVDLPVDGTGWRGCDEAWWLQAAIDACGSPQYADASPIPDSDHVRLRFFAPLPRWVKRQLDVLGEPGTAKGALFSYDVPATDLNFIRQFLAQHVWLTVVSGKGDRNTA
jgi:hypothetical protein